MFAPLISKYSVKSTSVMPTKPTVMESVGARMNELRSAFIARLDLSSLRIGSVEKLPSAKKTVLSKFRFGKTRQARINQAKNRNISALPGVILIFLRLILIVIDAPPQYTIRSSGLMKTLTSSPVSKYLVPSFFSIDFTVWPHSERVYLM